MTQIPDDWLEFAKEMHPDGDNLLRKFCEEREFRNLINDKIVKEYGLMAECAGLAEHRPKLFTMLVANGVCDVQR